MLVQYGDYLAVDLAALEDTSLNAFNFPWRNGWTEFGEFIEKEEQLINDTISQIQRSVVPPGQSCDQKFNAALAGLNTPYITAVKQCANHFGIEEAIIRNKILYYARRNEFCLFAPWQQHFWQIRRTSNCSSKMTSLWKGPSKMRWGIYEYNGLSLSRGRRKTVLWIYNTPSHDKAWERRPGGTARPTGPTYCPLQLRLIQGHWVSHFYDSLKGDGRTDRIMLLQFCPKHSVLFLGGYSYVSRHQNRSPVRSNWIRWEQLILCEAIVGTLKLQLSSSPIVSLCFEASSVILALTGQWMMVLLLLRSLLHTSTAITKVVLFGSLYTWTYLLAVIFVPATSVRLKISAWRRLRWSGEKGTEVWLRRSRRRSEFSVVKHALVLLISIYLRRSQVPQLIFSFYDICCFCLSYTSLTYQLNKAGRYQKSWQSTYVSSRDWYSRGQQLTVIA